MTNYIYIYIILYIYTHNYKLQIDFYAGSYCKESACSAGDKGSIPGLGRSPEEGNGNPHQYSCLENPIDRGAFGLQSMGSQRVRHD